MTALASLAKFKLISRDIFLYTDYFCVDLKHECINSTLKVNNNIHWQDITTFSQKPTTG